MNPLDKVLGEGFNFLGLKELSKWPTYPQIYLDGELMGGLDIVRENLTRDGKLKA